MSIKNRIQIIILFARTDVRIGESAAYVAVLVIVALSLPAAHPILSALFALFFLLFVALEGQESTQTQFFPDL